MTFRHFDTLVQSNEFWTMPLDRLNEALKRNAAKDKERRAGVSLVIGCPLPDNVLEGITELKRQFETALEDSKRTVAIDWRMHPEAFHFSLYGLVMPDDYRPERWPLPEPQLSALCSAFDGFRGTEFKLQGIGILGMGAISVRIANSVALEDFRDRIATIVGFSKERFGSRTKKIVIGRVKGPLGKEGRQTLRQACKACEETEVGFLTADSVDIVRYGNTFLEEIQDRIRIE